MGSYSKHCSEPSIAIKGEQYFGRWGAGEQLSCFMEPVKLYYCN